MSTVLCFLTAVAILCAITRLAGTFPYWTVIPAFFFVFSCVVAPRPHAADLAWGFIAIAWVITVLDLTKTHLDSFSFLGSPPLADEMRAIVLRNYAATLALPLFLTIPSARLAAKASALSPSHARKWIIVCPLVAFVDATLVTSFLLAFIELAWPYN